MKTITSWQPWATLWAAGIKKVETRSWSLDKIELPSRILIHAAVRAVRQEELEAIYNNLPMHSRAIINDLDYPSGCIIGACTLIRSERISSELVSSVEPTELALGLWEVGRWAWYSGDPILLDEPIKCRGNQLFWTPKPEVLDLVKLQLEGQGLPAADIL